MRYYVFIFLGIFLSPFLVVAHEGAFDTHTILITENGYEPEVITIEQGDTVVFKNVGTLPRWPASNIHPTHTAYPNSDIAKCGTNDEAGIFDACLEIAPGDTYDFTFMQPGNWYYHDHIDATLGGNIYVENTGLAVNENSFGKSILKKISQSIDQFLFFVLKTYYSIFPKELEQFITESSLLNMVEDEHKLKKFVSLVPLKTVLEKLLHEVEEGDSPDCHQEAHIIGRVAHAVYGSEVFTQGSALCSSGLYHGAMENHFYVHGTEEFTTDVKEICESLGSQFELFNCIHGVGHGILAYQNYEIPDALTTCGSLTNSYNRSACYGGVFMENIITAQGDGVIPAHETPWVDKQDPHFPCNAVGSDPEVISECYRLQTSWILHLNDYNFELTAYECAQAPKEFQINCYQSFGRDIAGLTYRDPKKIIELCGIVDNNKEAYIACVNTANLVGIHFTGTVDFDRDTAVCELIPASYTVARTRCFEEVEFRLWEMNNLVERPDDIE